jgi:membrane associated rhomboid family serine protease
MGLADRDYARDSSSRTAGASLISRVRRGRFRLSATVMVIIVCALVYVIDIALPKVPVQFGEWRPAPQKQQAFEDMRRSRVAMQEMFTPPDERGVGQVWLFPKSVGNGAAGGVFDPIASAEYINVSPMRGYLQFTTAQAVIDFDPAGNFKGGEFWRFVGYGFLHISFMHLAMNMLGLWIFGPVVEQQFGKRRYFAIFLLSVVMGALVYLLLNALGIAWFKAMGTQFLVPGLLFNDPYTPLIGASAGVYGIILASAWLRPNDEVLVLFVLPVKLKYFALGLIAVAVVTLLRSGGNAGGEAAHLGGAIAGWWVAQRPHLLDDFFSFFGPRVAGKRVTASKSALPPATSEVDRILDKVRAQGLGSLTERERDVLHRATDERRNSR